jgi:hypothetical protein
MKNIFAIIVFQTVSITCYSQISEEQFRTLEQTVLTLKTDRDKLFEELSTVKTGRTEIEKKLITINSNAFDQMQRSIRTSFDKTDVISTSTTYHQVINSIITLHNEITKVNNFTDAQKVFGIDFINQISTIAESTLTNQMIRLNENEPSDLIQKRKENFKSIISNILENPIVNSLVKSNPITSVAHSIINQTMSARATQITDIEITRGDYSMPVDFKSFKNDYARFKTSYETFEIEGGLPESKRLVLNESIQEFTKKLQPMIKLFDELSKINDSYESSLEVFLKASEQTIDRAKPVETEFYTKLGVKDRDEANDKINQFFNVGPNPSLDVLEDRLNSKEMNKVLAYTNEVNEVSILLENDFLKIITIEIELSDAYLTFFKELKAGKKGFPVFEETDALDSKIAQFSSLKSTLEDQKNKLEK